MRSSAVNMMNHMLLGVLLLIIKVGGYFAEMEPSLEIFNIEQLDEHREVFARFDIFEEGKNQQLPPFEQICYEAHVKCNLAFSDEPSVCAYIQKYGLINFPNICELRFLNCLMKAYEDRNSNVTFGDKHFEGLFYYNGRGEGCSHYVEATLSVDKAIQLYHMEDLEYKINQYERYAETVLNSSD